jgi:hypothetical protein
MSRFLIHRGGLGMFRHWLLSGILLVLPAGVAVAAETPPDPISPTDGVIRLFNGKDLAGWYGWLKASGREDPHRVYSVRDGVIRISGEGLGYLATERTYKDYHLVVEYRWGKKANSQGVVRNSGVLLHAVGPDGGFRNTFMTCIECQLAQGCEGDLIVIRGNDQDGKAMPATITCKTEIASDGRTRWKPGGVKTVYSGKQFWWSKHDPAFKEKLDTRGRWDVASRLGQWTRLDCICDGNRITIQVNGVTVNECFDAWPSAGKILLEDEGNEIEFRTLELHPLEGRAKSKLSRP